jgi:hypothetical protein
MTARTFSAVIALTLLAAACVKPPLRITSRDGTVTVDVQTLGEYPTDISSVMIFEVRTAKLVWHLVSAREDRFQLHTLQLHTGPNPAAPEVSHGIVRAQVPYGATVFELQRGVAYRVFVCRPGWFGGCRDATFQF